MTCAPCAAASLISSDAFSIFSFTSLPQPICMAATVVFLISYSSHPPGISRYLLCNTMNVPTTDNNITCVNRVYLPSGKKPPYDVHSLCIHFILKLGNQDSPICNIKINIACGKPLPCFSLLLPLFKGKPASSYSVIQTGFPGTGTLWTMSFRPLASVSFPILQDLQMTRDTADLWDPPSTQAPHVRER